MSTIQKSAIETANKIKAVALDLVESNIEAALQVADCYGTFLATNFVGLYADLDFEANLASHVSRVLEPLECKRKKGTILHLITSAFASGGHTRVVERFTLNGLGEGVASLDRIPDDVANRLKNRVKIQDCLRKETFIETINSIIQVGADHSHLILHIHPNDIASAIAARVLKSYGVKIYFYNHADHCFSYGYAASDTVFEISKYGWVKGGLRGIEDKQSYVGIPVDNYNPSHSKTIKGHWGVIGVASGQAGKFKPWGQYNFALFLNRLFGSEISNNVKIKICGPTGKEPIWKELTRKSKRHVTFTGRVPHREFIDLVKSADFYLDSFPQGNGTGFVEPLMLGVPVFGLNLLAGCSYADTLRSHSIGELDKKIKQFLENIGNTRSEQQEARRLVIEYQSVDACIDRVRRVINGGKNIVIPQALFKMECRERLYEEMWASNNRIYTEVNMLKSLGFIQKIAVTKSIIVGAWRYMSLKSFFYRNIYKLFISPNASHSHR